VLACRRAVRAGATRAAPPREADTLARLEASRPGPAALDLAHDLVAGDDRRSHERQVALDDVKVGAADTTCGDPHADLAGARLGDRAGLEAEGLALDRRLSRERQRSHDASLSGAGVKTSLMTAIWFGWIEIFPVNPMATASSHSRRRPARSAMSV